MIPDHPAVNGPSSARTGPRSAGGWRAGLLAFGVLAIIVALSFVVIQSKWDGILRYGLVINLNSIEDRLGREFRLTTDQYDELRQDVEAQKNFVRSEKLTRAVLARYWHFKNSFDQALQDGQVTRDELDQLRGISLAAGPAVAPAAPPTVAPVKTPPARAPRGREQKR